MRLVMLLCGCFALSGCQTGQPPPNGTKEKQPVVSKTARPPSASKKTKPPIVTPASGISGRVALVNTLLRYVIVDFSLSSQAPMPEQKMGVYRQGVKVGEIKISEQSQALNFAADITAGEVQMGDVVRPD